MSKLILPSPVILASQSFDVNGSGVGPAGLATLSAAGTIEPLRFLIPTYSVVKDSSMDIEIFASSTQTVAANYTLQPKLIFSEPDFGALNRVTYTLATMEVNTNSAAQLIRFSIKVAFTKGANGDAAALKPYAHSVGTSADVDGGVRTNFETGTYATGSSPSLTFFNRPRALTVQLVRVGVNTSVMNVNYIRAVGYNLNLDNATI
jgi:hypothetical protein